MKTMMILFKLEAIGKIMAIRAAIYKMRIIAILLIKVSCKLFLSSFGKFPYQTDINIH